MIKYIFVSLLLKLFSFNSLSKKAYRRIGNTYRKKYRPERNINSYLKRGKLFLKLCEKYQIVKDDDKLFEIGTGWMHWYSLYIRLFYNVKITMMDIWDNRQLEALKASIYPLKERSEELPKPRCFDDINFIVKVDNFKKLYDRFNLNYVIEEQGSLSQFPSNSYNLIYSFHVLEHVPKGNTNDLAKNTYRMLKPGGYSIHQIGIDDHLTHYSKKVSDMNYLRYSDTTWKLLFQNEVQYINRLLMSDWLDIFAKEGFIFMEKVQEFANIDSLKIHPRYQGYTKEDLSCMILTVVHKKPE